MHYAASVSSAPVFKAGQVHFPLFLMGYLYDPVGRINLDPIPGFDDGEHILLRLGNHRKFAGDAAQHRQGIQIGIDKGSGTTPLILLHFSIPLVPEEPFVD